MQYLHWSHIHQAGVKNAKFKILLVVMCKCCRQGVNTRVHRACEYWSQCL